MYTKIKKLAERNRKALTLEERASIAAEMEALRNANPQKYVRALERLISETSAKVEGQTLAERMGDMSKLLSMSFISEKYFGKTRSWLTQRMNGNLVNGKSVSLNEDEMKLFKDALLDISEKLRLLSESL